MSNCADKTFRSPQSSLEHANFLSNSKISSLFNSLNAAKICALCLVAAGFFCIANAQTVYSALSIDSTQSIGSAQSTTSTESSDSCDLANYPDIIDSVAQEHSDLSDKFDSLPLSHFPPRSDSGDSNMSLPQENQSDLDHDGDVDLIDLSIFSSRWLELDYSLVDWCEWLKSDCKKQKHRQELLDFICYYFQCEPPPPPPVNPFLIVNKNRFPVRCAAGPNDRLYVTDAKAGSVFLYDTSLKVIGELKGFNSPLGVAVDPRGNIYVGNGGNHAVEVYNAAGYRIRTIGEGLINMPNDLALDRNGNLYVVDSRNDKVWVFDSSGTEKGSIGRTGNFIGELIFPVAAEVVYRYDVSRGTEVGELYIADQGHSLIQVYDLQGNYLRSFGGKPIQGRMGMGWIWYGRFVKLQSMSFDAYGRLHAVDSYANRVQILDPVKGTYISSYGSTGSGAGKFLLPLDIIISVPWGIVVSDYLNNRLERLPSP